jgi:hypothetical protein
MLVSSSASALTAAYLPPESFQDARPHDAAAAPWQLQAVPRLCLTRPATVGGETAVTAALGKGWPCATAVGVTIL